jgi:hypothetical protein
LEKRIVPLFYVFHTEGLSSFRRPYIQISQARQWGSSPIPLAGNILHAHISIGIKIQLL